MISSVQMDPPTIPVNYVFIKDSENMFVFTYANEENLTDEIRSGIQSIIESLSIQ